MLRMGIDAGAYSIQLAVLAGDGQILYQQERPHNKKVKETTVQLVNAAATELKLTAEQSLLVCGTGSMSHLLNLPQTAVISEQALRLGLTLEEISEVVAKAQSVPDIAGRCSVFSKTDMIHRMQEGLPTADILLGLCFALVRNFKSQILQNRKPRLPVYLAGGTMKNEGVLRAIRELFSLQEEDMIRDENSAFLGALGAARAEKHVSPVSLPGNRCGLDQYQSGPFEPAAGGPVLQLCQESWASSGYCPYGT